MTACPVCETPIPPAALECATCGHIFHHAAVDASIAPLAELEPTSAKDLDVPVEATPGLEATAFEGVPNPAAEVIADLETTATGAVQVGFDATPDLEPTRISEDDLPTAVPTVIRCRYCGTEGQAQGLFCDRCGMRLPRLGDAVAEEEGDAPVPEGTKCRVCSGRMFAAGRCTECGARQPSAE